MKKRSKSNRKLLLCIDIGNISIDNAILKDGVIVHRLKTFDNSIPKYSTFFNKSGVFKLKYANICSVVPLLRKKVILELKKSHIQSFSIFSQKGLRGTPTLIKGAYRNLGEDRQIGLWMASRLYKLPLILVDLGSAITIDVLNKHRAYGGGIILPGFKMWASSLRRGTALLPETGYRRLRTHQLLGKSTKSCIHAGLCFGPVAMINGLLTEIKKRHGNHCTVILTGGDLDKVSLQLTHRHVRNESLVLTGLYELFYNRGEVR